MSEYFNDSHYDKRQGIMSLVLAVYRVTDNIAEHEPLRLKLREECLNVVSASERFMQDNVSEKSFIAALNSLLQFLSIAQRQGLGINELNFVVLEREFRRIRHEFLSLVLPTSPLKEGSANTVDRPTIYTHAVKDKVLRNKKGKKNREEPAFSARQEKLFSYLEKHRTAQIKDLQHLFPEISSRTVRRDLDGLVRSGLISRKGKTNGTSYTFIRTKNDV